jgi:hypothetical protein
VTNLTNKRLSRAKSWANNGFQIQNFIEQAPKCTVEIEKQYKNFVKISLIFRRISSIRFGRRIATQKTDGQSQNTRERWLD